MQKTASKPETQVSPRKIAAILAAREQRRGAVATMEERTRLLKALLHLLKSGTRSSIPESELAASLYGENTDTTRKKVIRHLTALHNGQHLEQPSNELGLQRVPTKGARSFAWTADVHSLQLKLGSLGTRAKNDSDVALTRDRALALALARKYLRDVMPPHLLQALEGDFNEAETLVQQLVLREGMSENLNLLRQRVDMAQRGQHLKKADLETVILDGIYTAITTSRRVSFEYPAAGKAMKQHNKMSVAGVLLRTPKLYLYALPDGRENQPENYRAYQVNLISNLQLHPRMASAIPHFDMRTFIQDGYTDILIDATDRTIHNVQIEVVPVGNLIRDLQTFPLHRQQSLKKQKNGNYLLSFPSRRTHQLVEYIVGRGGAFKVKAPTSLVDDITGLLSEIQSHYPNER